MTEQPSSPFTGPARPRRHAPSLVLGVCIILFGLALTLDQLNVPHAAFLVKLWPLILLAVGAAKLRQSDGFHSGGLILIVLGAYLLVSNFTPGGLADSLWPLMLVAIGIAVVMKSVRQRRDLPGQPGATRGTGADAGDRIEATAIFSGCRRQPQGRPFRGGDATAIFGGLELDLRSAEPSPEPMVLDLFILFGGGEIRVPAGWAVDIQTNVIFGGVGHKLPETPAPGAPRLVLTGTALFGGLEVRH
ncbi:MAG TPA: DUF5668 domain-containing protein [Holophagaceae bacterium]|nr:DUF5668 domain-containing protein [Holophagaceae bacterium]